MATTLFNQDITGWLYGKNGTTGRYKYSAEVILNSQSVANNTSNVTVNLYLIGDSNSGTTMWSASATSNQPYGEIAGDVSGVGSRIASYKKSTTPLQIATYTGDVSHADDGTKTLSLEFKWIAGGLNYYPETQTLSTNSVALPTIARASTFRNVPTNGTITSTSNGISFIVHANATFYHKLTWSLDGSTGTLLNGTSFTGDYSVSLAGTTILKAIQTGLTKTVTFTLTTYSDSAMTSQVGSNATASTTITVDSSAIKPSVAFSSITAVSPLGSNLVGGHSSVTVVLNVTRSYGAKTVNVTVGSTTATVDFTSSSDSTLSKSATLSIAIPESISTYQPTASVVDCRGASGSNVQYSTALTVYKYSAPTVTTNIYRCNSSGTADPEGAYVYIGYTTTISLSAQGNTKTETCYKSSSTTNISSGTIQALADSQSATFTVTVKDKITTGGVSASVTIAPAQYPLDLYQVYTSSGSDIGAGICTTAEANKIKFGKPLYGTTDTISAKHQITTSFKDAVAMGSYGTAQTTLEGFLNEIKFSNGATGSFSLNTAYTRDGITIPTGWYNFIYSPHRTGGLNGGANGDNTNYGNLILMGMTGTRKVYKIRVSGGYVDELITSSTVTDFSNAIAKGETKYTGTITWGSWVTAQTENELIRIGNVVQCRIRWKSSADTNTNSPQIGTIPNGFKPALQFYAQANVCWSNVQVPISINPTSGVIAHMNKVYAINTNYIITATWLTSDDYPS